MNDTLLQTAQDSLDHVGDNGTMVANGAPLTDPRLEAARVAEQWYVKRPDWTTFFREILGVQGVVRRLFPTAEERSAFERTGEFAEIKRLLAKLRDGTAEAESKLDEKDEDKEPTRVITVRMPQSMHRSLREEAQSKKTSMNTLCIVKLLHAIDDDLLPAE